MTPIGNKENTMAQSANPFYAYSHANETINQADQIILLYCLAISYIQQAKEAVEKEDHDRRYTLVEKTLSVMRGLRACLDFSANPKVATALNNYYETLDELLVGLQTNDNKQEICDMIITNLKMVKEAWQKVNLVVIGEAEESLPKDVVV
jgi:flagellar biosynthetic protein FliS